MTEYCPFSDIATVANFEQGEHVTVIGPTGTGKTTVLRAMSRVRERQGGALLLLGTKRIDSTLDRWARSASLTTIRDWPAPWWRLNHAKTPEGVDWRHRLILRPPIRSADDLPIMSEVMGRALASVYADGGWTVCADELLIFCSMLGLSKPLELLWTQGRSAGVTVLGGMQRPVDVSRYSYTQASHLFFFATADRQDVQRMGGIGGLDMREVERVVTGLSGHDMLYLNTRKKDMYLTRLDRKDLR